MYSIIIKFEFFFFRALLACSIQVSNFQYHTRWYHRLDMQLFLISLCHRCVIVTFASIVAVDIRLLLAIPPVAVDTQLLRARRSRWCVCVAGRRCYTFTSHAAGSSFRLHYRHWLLMHSYCLHGSLLIHSNYLCGCVIVGFASPVDIR